MRMKKALCNVCVKGTEGSENKFPKFRLRQMVVHGTFTKLWNSGETARFRKDNE
jgi:hypothetical protein